MPIEIELKLRIAPADCLRFQQQPLLKDKPVRVEQLHTTYFDTPSFELRKMGYVLRIRQIEDRFIQTVKTSNSSTAGLHEREEWEYSVPQLQPDYNLFPEAHIREQLLTSSLGERIAPLFYSSFQRRSWILQFPEALEIELALDVGIVASGELEESFSEVELELKSGDKERLPEIVALFASDIALIPENTSKANRGFKLYAAGNR